MKYWTILCFLLFSCQATIHLPNFEEELAIGNTIIETQEGGFLIAGKDKKSQFVSRGWFSVGKSFLAKTNKNGQLKWTKKFHFWDRTTINDLLELENEDIFVINPESIRFDGRDPQNFSYFTKLDKNGNVAFQRIRSGVLLKMIKFKQDKILIVGLNRTSQTLKKPFVLCYNISGQIIWEKAIEDEIDWVDEIFLKNDNLIINSSSTVLTKENKPSKQSTRKIFSLSTITKDVQTEVIEIFENEILSVKENLSLEFYKSSDSKEDWQIKLKDHTTQKTSKINLPMTSKLNLIPRIQLNLPSTCLYQQKDFTRITQLKGNSRGEIYAISPILKTPPNNKDNNSFIQSNCFDNLNGFLVVKLKKNLQLDWVKHFKEKLIPLNINIGDTNKTYITGTSQEDLNKHKMFYLTLNP